MNIGANDYTTIPIEENELLKVIKCRLKKRNYRKILKV